MNKCVLLIAILVGFNAFPAVIYVDVNNTSGIEDGLSWDSAYTEIQNGIDASAAGDELWVSQGIYDEERSSLLHDPVIDTGSVLLRSDISLYGGFIGGESSLDERDWLKHETIIDGSKARGGEPSYHVVYGAANVVLDGFTVMGSHRADPNFPRISVVGLQTDSEGMIVRNCFFKDAAGFESAGISSTISITVLTSVFSGQRYRALVARGLSTIESCTFVGNSGGGLTASGTLVVRDCVFRNNTSDKAAGLAVGAGPDDLALVQDCLFVGNSADTSGGAMTAAALQGNGEIAIERCVFRNNRARNGGALFLAGNPINVFNSIFWNNHAEANGGAIFVQGYVDPFIFNINTLVTVFNSTFVGNTGVPFLLESNGFPVFDIAGTGAIHSDEAAVGALNSIFWKNSEPEVTHENLDGSTLTNSLLNTEPRGMFLENPIEGNPRFVDASKGDFRIWGDSVAVDSGTSEPTFALVYPPDDDIIGTPRPLGDGFDIGAFEFDPDNPPMLPEEDDDSSSNSPCFIATAAYGTPLAEEINALRSFRDTRLLTNPLGASFVDTYYRLSPPLADYIASHPTEKSITRAFLTPLIAAAHTSPSTWILIVSLVSAIIFSRAGLMRLGSTRGEVPSAMRNKKW